MQPSRALLSNSTTPLINCPPMGACVSHPTPPKPVVTTDQRPAPPTVTPSRAKDSISEAQNRPGRSGLGQLAVLPCLPPPPPPSLLLLPPLQAPTLASPTLQPPTLPMSVLAPPLKPMSVLKISDPLKVENVSPPTQDQEVDDQQQLEQKGVPSILEEYALKLMTNTTDFDEWVVHTTPPSPSPAPAPALTSLFAPAPAPAPALAPDRLAPPAAAPDLHPVGVGELHSALMLEGGVDLDEELVSGSLTGLSISMANVATANDFCKRELEWVPEVPEVPEAPQAQGDAANAANGATSLLRVILGSNVCAPSPYLALTAAKDAKTDLPSKLVRFCEGDDRENQAFGTFGTFVALVSRHMDGVKVKPLVGLAWFSAGLSQDALERAIAAVSPYLDVGTIFVFEALDLNAAQVLVEYLKIAHQHKIQFEWVAKRAAQYAIRCCQYFPVPN